MAMRLSTEARKSILYNLRYRWKEELSKFSDDVILQEYLDFSESDMHGDNDARFLEWIEGVEE